MRADGITGDGGDVPLPGVHRGRPHFAVKLMECGLASSGKSDALPGIWAPAEYYVRRNHIPFDRAVEILRDSWRQNQLAHPFHKSTTGG